MIYSFGLTSVNERDGHVKYIYMTDFNVCKSMSVSMSSRIDVGGGSE